MRAYVYGAQIYPYVHGGVGRVRDGWQLCGILIPHSQFFILMLASRTHPWKLVGDLLGESTCLGGHTGQFGNLLIRCSGFNGCMQVLEALADDNVLHGPVGWHAPLALMQLIPCPQCIPSSMTSISVWFSSQHYHTGICILTRWPQCEGLFRMYMCSPAKCDTRTLKFSGPGAPEVTPSC